MDTGKWKLENGNWKMDTSREAATEAERLGTTKENSQLTMAN
jgi:hypothetical protein